MYNELYHHGILGQKWGIRRYQNPDGSLTQKGIKRYKARAEKYKARAEKRANVAARTKSAEIKANAKAKKWAKKMEKYITETKTNEVNAEQIALARKYLGM